MQFRFSPLFVGGTGRSGTTIILNLLKDHPQVHSSLPREIKYLTSRYGLIDLNFTRPFYLEEDFVGKRHFIAAKVLNLVGRNKEKFFHSYITSTWWSEVGKKEKPRGLIQGISFEQLQSSINIFLDNYDINRLESSRDLFYQLSRAQIKKTTVKYFADSTPVNMMQAHYLKKFLPDAKFINMIRDGRDVALSVAREKWGPNDPFKALDWWANRLLVAHQSLSQVPGVDQMQLRLEDLIVNNRDFEYMKILRFLNIEDFSTVRDYFNQQMLAENMNQAEWRTVVKDPVLYDRKYEKILKKLRSKGIEIVKFY
jgi:hypothetical protein